MSDVPPALVFKLEGGALAGCVLAMALTGFAPPAPCAPHPPPPLQVIAEFVNPKYADASKTAFKSSTRLECMMQASRGREASAPATLVGGHA